MASHLQAGLLIAVVAILLGAALVALARRKLLRWALCDALIVSTQSRDSDWDIVHIHFQVARNPITTTVTTQSQLGFSRKRGESIPIRYNPAMPQQARLASSRSKLH